MNTETEKIAWPKRYEIRRPNQVTLPTEILSLLGWRQGDSIAYTLDRSNGALVLTKHTALKSRVRSSVSGK